MKNKNIWIIIAVVVLVLIVGVFAFSTVRKKRAVVAAESSTDPVANRPDFGYDPSRVVAIPVTGNSGTMQSFGMTKDAYDAYVSAPARA